jgi:excisionase family DNA binding protein
MSKLEDTISIVEAARRLNVEVNYAYALARSGRLEARLVGRRWFVSAKAVEERLARLDKSHKWKT